MNPIATTLIIMAATIVLLVIDKLPIALVCLASMLSLTLTSVLTPAQAFSGFTNNTVILVISMMVVGEGMFKSGLASDITHGLMRFAKTDRMILAVIMIVSGLLSAVLTNPGVVAMMIPIVAGICRTTKIPRSKLMMPIAIATGCGGIIALPGGASNTAANAVLQGYGYAGFSFFEMAKAGIPILLLTTLFLCTIGWKLLPDRPYEGDDAEAAPDFSAVPKSKKILTAVIILLTFLGMVFTDQIGIPMHVTSCIGALAMVLTRVLTEKEALKAIDLRTPFILAGLLPLATALETTGAGDFLAEFAVNAFTGLSNPIFLLIAMYLISAVATQFLSNTATSAVLCPIGLSIAHAMAVDPKAIMVAIVFGASFGYATPLAMPLNTMVMNPGGYRFNDYVKVGVPLVLLSAVVACILLPIMWPI